MPRKSPEARQMHVLDVVHYPPAPRELCARSAAIWDEIVRSKPADWFDPGSFRLLRLYCETLVQAEDVLAEIHSGTVEKTEKQRLLIMLNQSCGMLATRLRLSVQSRIDGRSKIVNEKGPEDANDRLIGGSNTWPGLRVAS